MGVYGAGTQPVTHRHTRAWDGRACLPAPSLPGALSMQLDPCAPASSCSPPPRAPAAPGLRAPGQGHLQATACQRPARGSCPRVLPEGPARGSCPRDHALHGQTPPSTQASQLQPLLSGHAKEPQCFFAGGLAPTSPSPELVPRAPSLGLPQRPAPPSALTHLWAASHTRPHPRPLTRQPGLWGPFSSCLPDGTLVLPPTQPP